LRDVTAKEVASVAGKLPDVVARRCRHVVLENERVQQAVGCLSERNLTQFGKFMNESHASLRDDYQVSCRELDVLVELTQKQKGVLGARMTGAGFGGCTVAIMETSAVDDFQAAVLRAYEKQTGCKPTVYICSAVGGAQIVEDLAAAKA
jgi:galactokinase